MPRGRLAVVLVNALVFVALAEGLALVLFYENTGHLFYDGYRTPYASIPETERGQLTADALHPYFGPLHRPGVRPETNNVGFGSPHPFPVPRADRQQFHVGVFGGSVARQFCDAGMPRLAASLERVPALAGRKVVSLCFSHEGYKQPQQLQVLAYFLAIGQELDLALNIDGFNEVALGTYNHERGRDISMPSPLHLDPLLTVIDRSALTSQGVQLLAAIARDKEAINRVVERLQRNRLAAIDFVLGRYHAFLTGRYQAAVAQFAALPPPSGAGSPVLLTPALAPREGDALYEDIAASWARASLLMRDLLAARGATYIHVLQPNQYFSRRQFGADEARVALNPDTPFRRTVEAGYPALIRAAAALATSERFIDATTALDAMAEPAYSDDCCHYTRPGYERLADVIAARAASWLSAAGTAAEVAAPAN